MSLFRLFPYLQNSEIYKMSSVNCHESLLFTRAAAHPLVWPENAAVDDKECDDDAECVEECVDDAECVDDVECVGKQKKSKLIE